MHIILLIIFFALYSFTGWIIEVIYRSYTRKKFINPGFLYGPFVPVYGIGALFIVLLQQYISPLPLIIQFVIYTLILSAIEFITGEIFEYFFGLKLWDYSDTKFNIKGKVSLIFSLGWGVLAIGVSHFMHPFISSEIHKLNSTQITAASTCFTAYFVTDTGYSVASLNRFRRDLAYLYEKYSTLSSLEAQRIITSFRRILEAFPHLNGYLNSNLSENLKHRVNNMKEKLSETIESVINNRKAADQEYMHIVSDILDHNVFKQLENFFHHNSSIYEHAKVVSYASYKICKFLNLDYRSAARGGLLHDFFLYDWRNHAEPDLPKEIYHGRAHPKIALDNSMKHFVLNEVEKDIIVKHMWPLTFIPPKYQESYVVTFADKYISSREFIDEFKKRQMGKIKRRKKKGAKA
jgi:uncharacterized membrane protein